MGLLVIWKGYSRKLCIHVKWPLPPGDNPIAVNKYYYIIIIVIIIIIIIII